MNGLELGNPSITTQGSSITRTERKRGSHSGSFGVMDHQQQRSPNPRGRGGRRGGARGGGDGAAAGGGGGRGGQGGGRGRGGGHAGNLSNGQQNGGVGGGPSVPPASAAASWRLPANGTAAGAGPVGLTGVAIAQPANGDGGMADLVDQLTQARITEHQRARQQQLEDQRLSMLRDANARLRKVFADVIGKESIKTIMKPGNENLLVKNGVGNFFGPPHLDSKSGPRLLDHVIGAQAMHLFENDRPKASQREQRLQIAGRVKAAILAKWPTADIDVQVFGSTVTEIDHSTSDVDLVLLDGMRPFGAGTPYEYCNMYSSSISIRQMPDVPGCYPEYYNVRKVADALRASGQFTLVQPIRATVSIVKFRDRATGIDADININERFGLVNSQLIKAYCDIRPKLVRPMIYLLKKWAGSKDLNDPSGKTGPMSFSSYTLALMVINYLQEKNILPNLQDPGAIELLQLEHTYLWRGKRQKNAIRGRPIDDTDEEPGYDVTTYDLAEYSSTLKEIMDPSNARFLKSNDDETYGVPSVDPRKKDEQYMELGKHIRGFFAYMEYFPKRVRGISVSEGSTLSLEPQKEDKWKPYSVHARSLLTAQDVPPHATPADRYRVMNNLRCEDIYQVGTAITQLRLGDIRCLDNMLFPGKFGGGQAQWVVQDPFILDRNTAQNVTKGVAKTWEQAVAMAVAWLNDCEREGTLPNLADMLLPSEVVERRPQGPEAALAQKVLQKWKAFRRAVQERGDGEMEVMYGGWYLQ